jgi:hypothetical protein
MKQKHILFLLILISGFAKAQFPFTPKGLEMICHKVNQWDIDPILVDSFKFTYDNNFSHDTSKIYTKFYGNGNHPTIELHVDKHTNSMSKVSDIIIKEATFTDESTFINQLLESGYGEVTNDAQKQKGDKYFVSDSFYVRVFHKTPESVYATIKMYW